MSGSEKVIIRSEGVSHNPIIHVIRCSGIQQYLLSLDSQQVRSAPDKSMAWPVEKSPH
jgi:hypothetical protein